MNFDVAPSRDLGRLAAHCTGRARGCLRPQARLCNTAGELIFRAGRLEEFLRLHNEEKLPLVAAAQAAGLSPSSCCGANSMLARYARSGIAGLQRRRAGQPSNLSQRIESLSWFIPAVRFFLWSQFRKRGALAKAARRAVALPSLPSGWSRATRSRFLDALGLEALPVCPSDLRQELLERERAGKPILPDRIARQAKTSPAAIRRYSYEARIEHLASLPFSSIARRLAALKPGATCRLTLEVCEGSTEKQNQCAGDFHSGDNGSSAGRGDIASPGETDRPRTGDRDGEGGASAAMLGQHSADAMRVGGAPERVSAERAGTRPVARLDGGSAEKARTLERVK